MQEGLLGIVFVPLIVSCVLFFLLLYVFGQVRKPYLRCWLVAWGAYATHTGMRAWEYTLNFTGPMMLPLQAAASLALVMVAACTLRAAQEITDHKPRYMMLLGAVALGAVVTVRDISTHIVNGQFDLLADGTPSNYINTYAGIVLLVAVAHLLWFGRKQATLGMTVYVAALGLWSLLLSSSHFMVGFSFGDFVRRVGHPLGTLPQVLVGLAQIMMLFEDQRRTVLDNAVAFGTLGVDGQSATLKDLSGSLQGFLERLLRLTPGQRGVLWIRPEWRSHFPSVQVGLQAHDLAYFVDTDAGAELAELAAARDGVVVWQGGGLFASTAVGRHEAALREALAAARIRKFTAISLRTRGHDYGVLLLADAAISRMGELGQAPLQGLARQIAQSLEHYVAVQDANRRTREHALLTQIGQAIAAHLDEDSLLRTIHAELGQLLDNRYMFVAFRGDGGQTDFRLESEEDELLPRRVRARAKGLAEYVMDHAKPVLIRSHLAEQMRNMGCSLLPPRPAKSLLAAPILVGGVATGVIAAIHPEREFAFSERDLEVMQTVAGQVSVAMENARLYADEQRRARHFALLNRISELALGSEDATELLNQVVDEVQRHFGFDLVTVGLVDYASQEIEIRAMAGSAPRLVTTRLGMGSGLLGSVARSAEPALLQGLPQGSIHGMLPEARSAICVPLFTERTLGVLCAESKCESCFSPQDVQVIKTLADLLGGALHNVIVFQNMQRQSITDSLTGVKTRRFFLEALHQEWKRSSRSGRPFAVVMVDLDNFKQVNDTSGHLEGDLILARVGRQIERRCRQSNVVARYGGDEFVVLMPETGVEQAVVLADRLRRMLAGDPVLSKQAVTASLGVAVFPLHGFTGGEILRSADAAMYSAKNSGGDRVVRAADVGENDTAAARRHLVSSYVDDFLKQEQVTHEDVERLVTRLQAFEGGSPEETDQFLLDAVEMLNHAAEARESLGADHAHEVERYATLIGREVGLDMDAMADLTLAARFHDVGKVFVPESILGKPGMLSEEEFEVVKQHPSVGAEILQVMPESERLCETVRHHHESFDGTGYPDALAGEEIPLTSRVLAVADAFANMLADRPFAAAKTVAQAVAELERMSGTRFDPKLAAILARHMESESNLSSIAPQRT